MNEVVIVDVDISFGNLVGLLVKLAFAVIPALLIIGFILFGIALFFGVVTGVEW